MHVATFHRGHGCLPQYGLDGAEEFCAEMSEELGMPFTVAHSSEQLCQGSDVIFTQTPGGQTVLELGWLSVQATFMRPLVIAAADEL